MLLLERHNIPGGCATSFCRGRFEFEVALHQLSGVGTPENPGPLRMLLSQLGVLDDLELVEVKDLFQVIGPGDFRLALKPDRLQVIAALQERFPKEREGIERFFDLSYQYAYQMLSAFYFKDPEPSREKYPVLYHYAYKPAIEVLNELFTDPLLKAVISSYWGFLGLPPTPVVFRLSGHAVFHVYRIQALSSPGRLPGLVQRPDQPVFIPGRDGPVQLRGG